MPDAQRLGERAEPFLSGLLVAQMVCVVSEFRSLTRSLLTSLRPTATVLQPRY